MSLKLGSTSIGSLYLGSTKIGEAYLGNVKVYESVDPYNPLNLSPYTIRLKFNSGVTPTFANGTAVQVSSNPDNVWDLTYEDSNWNMLLNQQTNLVEVLGANSTGVTSMQGLFSGDTSLTTVQLFDTSAVNNLQSAFQQCSALTSLPLFDVNSSSNCKYICFGCSELTNVPLFNFKLYSGIGYAFSGCYKVQSGALALYQKTVSMGDAATSHSNCFTDCGRDTVTGAAELAQIPTSWGGTMS